MNPGGAFALLHGTLAPETAGAEGSQAPGE